MNILLLEDFKLDADLALRSLKSNLKDCNIDIASSIKEARKLIHNEYDVALLDIHLPDGYGTELLNELVERNDQMIIIMLTGSGDEEVAVTSLKSGADNYMIKEGDYLEHLPGIITYHFEQRGKKEKVKKKIINVLYLEDQLPDIELTLIHFRRYAFNFRIHPVTNGQQMLAALPKSEDEECEFQVVLMDYNLPGLTAIELAKEIRQERKLDIPIVIVTSQGSEEVAIQALKLGVDEYLVKGDNYLNRLPSLLTSAFQKHELITQNKQLIESERKFRHSFDYANVGKALVGLDGTLLQVNPKLCLIMESDKEDIENKNIVDFIYKEDIALMQRMYFKSGRIHLKNEEFEIRVVNKHGKILWAIVSISLVEDLSDQPIYYVLHLQDITIRKEAIEKNRQLSLSVEQSPAMVLITDLKGRIKYVNPKFSEVTGYTREEVLDKNPRLLKSGNKSAEDYRLLWDTITKGKVWKGEFLNRKKDGTPFWESASISPLKDDQGVVTHFIAIKLDVTDQKRNEHRIRKLNEELEERVEERTKELYDANLKLEAARRSADSANKAKSEFLANMSHEIRTPMNAVLGFADILDRQIDNKVQKSYLKSIKSSGKTLLGIINDILDLSKIESGSIQLHPTPVDIVDLVKEVRNMFDLRAAEKGLELNAYVDAEIPNVLLLDELRIKQVLMNLISNAIKFTQIGYVNLKVKLLLKTNSTADISVCVEDSGIGVTKEGQSKILKPFEQQEGQDDKLYGGTGLGLAISDRIMLLHGSRIDVQSEVGKGSQFSFELKNMNIYYGDVPTGGGAVLEPDSVKFSGQTIFVVDDDAENRRLVKSYLENLNLTIVEIENGKIAVERILADKPDFVFMDMRMPKLSGMDAAKKVRSIQGFEKLPIILLTASVFYDTAELLKVFDDYLTKPIQIEQVLEILCKYLEYTMAAKDNNESISPFDVNLKAVLLEHDLKEAFQVSFTEILSSLQQKRSNVQIKQLANQLMEFGQAHQVKPIVELGSELDVAIRSYSIEEILTILHLLNQCL
ncbi:MAG: response regulator [Marinilabiliaceae bacterium]|nr:response regulator [Marinilabiliaceae bacterium]